MLYTSKSNKNKYVIKLISVFKIIIAIENGNNNIKNNDGYSFPKSKKFLSVIEIKW